jgi:hypothetical protein
MSAGTKVLNKIYNDLFLGLDDQKQKNVLDCLVSLKEIIKSKKNWLIPFIQQEDSRGFYKKQSYGMAYWQFCKMVENQEIYLKLFPLDNFAFKNSDLEQNQITLNAGNELCFEAFVKNDPQNNDGCIQLKTDLGLWLYTEDEKSEKEMESEVIFLEKDKCIPLEIGYNSILKFVYSLKYSGCIARFPYSEKVFEGNPFLAVFVYQQRE